MRAIVCLTLLAGVSAIAIPIASQALGGVPVVGQLLGGGSGSSVAPGGVGSLLGGGNGSAGGFGGLLGGSGSVGGLGDLLGSNGLLGQVGNVLQQVGGVLGQLLNQILINVGIILNAILNIVDEALAAVNIIVQGLLTGLLNSELVQTILNTLPPQLKETVTDLVEAVQCILNDVQSAVPAVQKAVIQLIGLLTSSSFASLDANTQLTMILNILGDLTQDEVTVVNTILQRLADALNNKSCPVVSPTMPTPPSLPGFSLPSIPSGGLTSPSSGLGGLLGGSSLPEVSTPSLPLSSVRPTLGGL